MCHFFYTQIKNNQIANSAVINFSIVTTGLFEIRTAFLLGLLIFDGLSGNSGDDQHLGTDCPPVHGASPPQCNSTHMEEKRAVVPDHLNMLNLEARVSK